MFQEPFLLQTQNVKILKSFLLKFLLEALKQNAKFSIPEVIAVWVRSKTRQCSSLLLMVLCGLFLMPLNYISLMFLWSKVGIQK